MSTSSAVGHVIVHSPTSPEASASASSSSVPLADCDVDFGRKYDGDAEDNNDDDRSRKDADCLDSETAAATDGKMDDYTEEDLLPFPDFEAKSLLVFRQTMLPRSWCLALITWSYPFVGVVYNLGV
jgi:hypothetical protein